MLYRIEILPSAVRELAGIQDVFRKRIAKAIDGLSKDPRPRGARLLEAARGILRIRVGDYRVLYQVRHDRLIILVIRIGHRREIYRRLNR